MSDGIGWANWFGTKMTHLDCVGDECSKKKSERAGEKFKKKKEKEKRMRAVGMFLNEGEKENKGKGGGGRYR